jgi:antitoxin component of MazEF toxin-antitoxin module
MFVEKKKIVTVGNSIAVTLKPKGSDQITLTKGDEVKVSYKGKKIIIEKVED